MNTRKDKKGKEKELLVGSEVKPTAEPWDKYAADEVGGIR
jgi:hypothetical protein